MGHYASEMHFEPDDFSIKTKENHAIAVMQKPTSEEIQKAIDYFGTINTEAEWGGEPRENDSEEYKTWYSGNRKRNNLVIKALRQMRTEPCELCKKIHISPELFCLPEAEQLIFKFEGDDDFRLCFQTVSKGTRRFVSGSITNCPSCGRKLKDGDDNETN